MDSAAHAARAKAVGLDASFLFRALRKQLIDLSFAQIGKHTETMINKFKVTTPHNTAEHSKHTHTTTRTSHVHKHGYGMCVHVCMFPSLAVSVCCVLFCCVVAVVCLPGLLRLWCSACAHVSIGGIRRCVCPHDRGLDHGFRRGICKTGATYGTSCSGQNHHHTIHRASKSIR